MTDTAMNATVAVNQPSESSSSKHRRRSSISVLSSVVGGLVIAGTLPQAIPLSGVTATLFGLIPLVAFIAAYSEYVHKPPTE